MLAAVMLITLLAYLRCLSNPFTLDDHIFLENHLIGSWSFLSRSLAGDALWFVDPGGTPLSPYYRPLLLIVLGFEYHLFGLNPAAFHAVSLLLHLLVVFLVFKIAARLTADLYAALLTALLFGLIPAHAEAVLSIAATNYPLGAAFQLGAFYLVISAGDKRDTSPLAVLLYLAALLCHENAIMLPALVAIYVLLLEPAGAIRDEPLVVRARARIGTAVIRIKYFALVMLLYMAFRVFVLHLAFVTPSVGAGHVSSAVLLLTLPRVMVMYVALMVVPWLAGDSDRATFVHRAASPDFYLPLITLTTLTVFLYMVLRNHPRRALYLFCILWIGIEIAPMLNLRGLWPEGEIANRYFYMPSVGWCMMLADWAVVLAHRGARVRQLVFAGTAAMLAISLIVLMNLMSLWHDEVALIRGRLTRFPESAYCHRALARALRKQGDIVGARHERETAARMAAGS